ncbi:hypothetical protein [Arthrobacter sp. NPDC056493]|uniref:hypothetical protein n=1 Tax=Arthrobacter sp. NPDC056493 TaxID=3345839 RepID=UPI00366BA4C8
MEDIDGDVLAKSLIDSLAASLVAEGRIDPRGMTEAEFQLALTTELREIIADGVEFRLIPDHQDSLLKQARAFAEASDIDFAIMFYATWIEHWLNWMYIWQAEQSDLEHSDAMSLIKQPMHHKAGIIWSLTFGQGLDADLLRGIRDVANWRNAFVHYKWLPDEEEDSLTQKKDRARQRLATAEAIVARLTALRNELALRGAQDFLGGRT